jgi:hypothetical protein
MSFAVRPPEVELARVALPMSHCGPGRYCHGGPVRGWCELHQRMSESTSTCPDQTPGGPVIKQAGHQNRGSANGKGMSSSEDGTILALGAVAALVLASFVAPRVRSSGSAIERVPNGDVPRYWARGQPAQGYGHLRTDGQDLYSYDLKIGYTRPNGEKVLEQFTMKGDYRSHTTSRHVCKARHHADRVTMPGKYRVSFRSEGGPSVPK